MAHPIILYDGGCGFCANCLAWMKKHLHPDADALAHQFADLTTLGVSAERAYKEVLWITPDGKVYGGAQAVAHIFIASGGLWAVLGWSMRIPPFRWLARGVYRLVAANRYRLPGGTPLCKPGSRPGSQL